MTSCSVSVCRARPLLGTYVEVTAHGAEEALLHAAIDCAFAAVERVHGLMSFQDPASELSRFNREGPSVTPELHPWTREVIDAALDFRERSKGAFDATAGAEGRLDLSGIAKGFAVDRAVDALCAAGVTRGIVNAGGDLAAFGPADVEVAVRDPADSSRLAAVVTLRNRALASSGRVIDPATGRAASGIEGASVSAPTCMLADALTKVVGVAGQAAGPLLQQHRATALMFSHGRTVQLEA
jgi:thiamine biosynthesis lipoprotein